VTASLLDCECVLRLREETWWSVDYTCWQWRVGLTLAKSMADIQILYRDQLRVRLVTRAIAAVAFELAYLRELIVSQYMHARQC